MPTASECIKKYGIDLWVKMCNTGYLDGITVVLLPTGEGDIPQRDIDIAFRAARGNQISSLEWD